MTTRNSIIILVILLLSVITGCRQKTKLTLTQELFAVNAKVTLSHDLRELTGKKIKLEKICILDTAWTEVTVYNDTCLAAMQKKLRGMTSMENAFSESDLLEDFERIEAMEKEIRDYRLSHKAIWGYKIEVAYKSGRQKDTINCEINRHGTEVRAINAGGEPPLAGLEELNKNIKLNN